MRKTLKFFGIIALVAVIGFSMAACGGGSSPTNIENIPVTPPLSAPTGLTATAISSSEIQLTWNAVAGAAGYNVYQSRNSSSGFQLLGTRSINNASNYSLPSNTTVYYQVAAYTADGTEGDISGVASATTLNPGSYSLDGLWWNSSGEQITVSGSTGVVTRFGALNTLWTDAISRGYITLGGQQWRYLTSTGTLTWSGQTLHVTYNSSNPNVATGTRWRDCTITMSTDGQTITFESEDSGGYYTYTYTRTYTPVGTPGPAVYTAGYYEIGGNDIYRPCYWVNGTRTELEIPTGKSGSAAGIAVSGNNVYVCGEYYESGTTYMPTACYWVNGQRTDLSVPTGITYSQTREIVVRGTTVYIAGQHRSGSSNNTRRACYWVNGERIDINAPNNRNADTVGIAIEGTTVYVLGVHGPTNDVMSFYFDMDARTGSTVGSALDLPSGSGDNNYYNTPGAMMGTTTIYLPGNVMISGVQRACYWRSGLRTDLPVPSGTTYSTSYSITIGGTTVYAVGRYETSSNQTACYWVNGTTRTDLTVTGASITRAVDIAVLGTNVYVSGSYGNSVENRQACYWANGTKTDLSVPAGTSFSSASTIVVVE
jgi:hypothetical protein